jgi:hypothetical protein
VIVECEYALDCALPHYDEADAIHQTELAATGAKAAFSFAHVDPAFPSLLPVRSSSAKNAGVSTKTSATFQVRLRQVIVVPL